MSSEQYKKVVWKRNSNKLESIINSIKKFEANFDKANDLAHKANLETWSMIENEQHSPSFDLNTNWLNENFSNLVSEIKILWEQMFPGIVEGMTWEGALHYQRAAGGELALFPPEIELEDEDIIVLFEYDEDENTWEVRITDSDEKKEIELVFLDGLVEVERYIISNDTERTLSLNIIRKSDRFIFQKVK